MEKLQKYIKNKKYKNDKIKKKYQKKYKSKKNLKKILRMKTKLSISGNTDQCLAMSLVILSIPLVC